MTSHQHDHGTDCGHTAIRHGDHVDYLHDGELHRQGAGGGDGHAVEVSQRNPEGCTPDHQCGSHESEHAHSAGCGHEQVPHGNHTDYLVEGHLHHPHDGHCDEHGSVDVVQTGDSAAR